MRRSGRFLLLVCSLFAPTITALAQAEVIVNDRTGDPAAKVQIGPQVASLGATAVVVWSERTGVFRDIQYAYSLDGGATFTDAGVPPVPSGWTWRIDPRVVINPADGAVYVCGQMGRTGRWGVGFVAGAFSGGSVVWGTPVVVEDLPVGTSITIGNLAMAMNAADNRVVVAYSTFPSVPIGTFVRYSDDGGASWSAAIQLDGPNPVGPGAVEASASASGDILVSWGDAAGSVEERRMRVWKAGNPGFGSAATVTTNPGIQSEIPPGASALGEVSGWPYVSQATDPSDGPYRGRTYMAWSEPFHLATVTFPPVTDPGLERLVESEPNDTALTAPAALLPGAILRGIAGSTSPMDADWYTFKLLTGERIAFWPDSLPPAWPYDLRVIAPDGVGRLTGCIGGSDGAGIGEKTGFVAPVGGNYYVRFAPRNGSASTPVGYRIRTAALSAGPEIPRDQADVMLTWSDDGTAWSAPTRANADPIGFHAAHVEVVAGYDGAAYLTWYDYSQSAYGGLSHRVVARSTDGGSSWGSPVNLSSVFTDWTAVVHSSDTKLGFEAGVTADPLGVRGAWTDGRNGDPDVYTGGFGTGFTLDDCPNGVVAAQAGDKLVVPVTVKSLNPLFGNTIHCQPRTERGWPEPATDTPLPAGETSGIAASFVVPDSAAPGPMQACLDCDIAGALRVTCCFLLEISAPLAVPADGAVELQLRIGPSPSRGPADLTFSLPEAGRARLAIYGARGERVRRLSDGALPAGRHHVAWDGSDEGGQPAPPGIYFARLEWQGRTRVARLVRIE